MVTNLPSSLPTPEVLPPAHNIGTVGRAFEYPQMAGPVTDTLSGTRTNLGVLHNQISPGIGPNFVNTALPAVALLGVVAVTWNAMNMVISGQRRGMFTGRKDWIV